MTVLHVAADDRTGALETAGACADAGLPAAVVTAGWAGTPPDAAAVVADLGTRHGGAAAAAAVAAALPGGRVAHKIDSTLRGVWAHELVARHRATGCRVLVVPAFPATGRTCRRGVVLLDGRPVASAWADARAAVSSSRPADHLRAAGATEVAELGGAGEVASWHAGTAPFAVCDAATDGDLAALGLAWAARPGTLLAGTAAAVGAAASAVAGPSPAPPTRPPLAGPVLVVCGSLHLASRRQVAALVAAGALALDGPPAAAAALTAGRVVVLASPAPSGPTVTADAAEAAAADLAARAAATLAVAAVGTLVVLGGDTAAAVLGPGPRWVGGLLGPGVAWCPPAGGEPMVVAKPGGFGPPDLLVSLLSDRMRA